MHLKGIIHIAKLSVECNVLTDDVGEMTVLLNSNKCKRY